MKKEEIQVIYLRENMCLVAMKLKVDEMARNIITLKDKAKRSECFLLIHKLMKPVFGYPGIKDGTRTLLICARDVRFDPLKELDESWNSEHIRARLKEIAKEQQHKAEQNKGGNNMQMATMMLAGCACVLFLVIGILVLAKYV